MRYCTTQIGSLAFKQKLFHFNAMYIVLNLNALLNTALS